MAKRETTVWVERSKVVPHPENPNRMTDGEHARLVANIRLTGMIPPLIVRSLEESEAFTDEHEKGLLQLLDGEQRWTVAGPGEVKHDGETYPYFDRKEVEVRIWHGITDDRAKQILAVFNRIGGTDDPAKRTAIIRALAEIEGDAESLALVLPEDAATISRIVEESTREAVSNATTVAATLARREPLTIFATPEQANMVRAAIARWFELDDARASIDDCREGAAISSIAEDWLASVASNE